MSEVMTPMSFEQLVDWVLQEKKKRGTVRTRFVFFSFPVIPSLATVQMTSVS